MPATPAGAAFLAWGRSQKSIILASKIRRKFLPYKRPLVPKVAPMGAPAEPEIHQKVENVVSEGPSKSDAGKNRVSDRLKHRKRSSRAGGGTVSAKAEHHRKVSETMPEGVQKRHRSLKKPSRNVSEITWRNPTSKNRKMSPKELPAPTPRHLKLV